MAEEKKYSIFDFSKLTLNSTQGKAQLKFNIYNNNPRIVVFTNEESDKKNSYGAINANLDPYVFNSFLQLLLTLIPAPADTKYKIENETLVGEGREKTRKVVSELMLGKDKDGVIWMSVIAPDRPKFKFELGDYKFHKFYTGSGDLMPRAEASQVAAKGMVTLLSQIFSTYVTTQYVHVPPSTYNKGKSGGYKNASVASEEDLPF